MSLGRVLTHDDEGFCFVTSEQVPSGEFVVYEDSGKNILCRVAHTVPLNTYPSEFLMQPSNDPANVARFIGMDVDGFGYLVAHATVIGHFDEEISEFCNPLTQPNTGVMINLAPDEMLSCISKVDASEKGSALVGKVFGRECPVALSTKDLVSQHLSIIAATGAGKSYTVGVLIEEMLGPRNKGAVLVFDPHGEYHTLSEMVELPQIQEDGYRPRVKVIRPEDIRIRYSDMEFGDILAVMDDGNLSDKMRVLMNAVYRNLRSKVSSGECNFTYDELRRELEERRDSRPEDETTYTALLWRLSKLDGPIFHDHMHQDLDEFFQVGQVTVLDLSGIDERYQQLIATIITRRVFDARKGTVNRIYGPDTGTDKFLPYPVFMVFEEAHRFAPQNQEAKSKWMLKTLLSEGRKFGIGVCLVSQRPAKLDQDALSQCMTQITMRIINPIDQSQVAAAVEGLSRDLLDRLPSLAKGEAVISGMAINTPTVTRIRKRYTTHGGQDIDAPDEWDRMYTGEGPKESVEEDEDLDLGYLKNGDSLDNY